MHQSAWSPSIGIQNGQPYVSRMVLSTILLLCCVTPRLPICDAAIIWGNPVSAHAHPENTQGIQRQGGGRFHSGNAVNIRRLLP